jgi:hypothetical protein
MSRIKRGIMRGMKLIRKKFYLLLLASATLYCSKQNNVKDAGVQEKTLCVNSFFSVSYSYFFHPNQLRETEENISCVSKSLLAAESFLELNDGGATLESFQSWLNQKYYENNPISSQHMASWLLFKRWLVGGDVKYIKAEEVHKLQEMLKHWQLFIEKVNIDLTRIVKTEKKESLKDLRKSYDSVFKKMNEFLNHFPHLISNFEYEGFVTLLFNNKTYHNNSVEEINPSLVRSLLWFSNGEESTIISKNTTQFMMLVHYHYFKFRRQVGEQWQSLIYKNSEFVSYSADLLADLELWLTKVKVFDYKGFKHLSSYISEVLFEKQYTSDQVFQFIKTLNEKYLSEDIYKSHDGLGPKQLASISDMLKSFQLFEESLESNSFELNDQEWVKNFLLENSFKGNHLMLNNNGEIDLSGEKGSYSDELLKLVKFVSIPLSRIIKVKAKFYISLLTEEEFNSLLVDFRIFESVWKVDQVDDYYSYTKNLGFYEQAPVAKDQLFFLVTRRLQSVQFKEHLERVSVGEHSSNH